MPDNLENIAWATMPPDGVHQHVWGKNHLVLGTAEHGARTLCGKTAPRDAFDLARGGWIGGEECLSCLRVLERRMEKGRKNRLPRRGS